MKKLIVLVIGWAFFVLTSPAIFGEEEALLDSTISGAIFIVLSLATAWLFWESNFRNPDKSGKSSRFRRDIEPGENDSLGDDGGE